MKCQKCKSGMELVTGEDEGSGDTLFEYSYYLCQKCGHIINDYDDEFEWPGDDTQPPLGETAENPVP